MNKISAIIVDDEELARENLAMLIDDFCPDIEVVAKSQNVAQAYQDIQKHQPDLIFLDIRMPSGTEGFDLLNRFDDPNFMVIFVTAFKDYAIEAMNANAIHYILKPIDIDDLESAVQKVSKLMTDVRSDHQVQQDYIHSLKQVYQQVSAGTYHKISISHAKGIKLIDPKKIVYIEAKSNCSELHLADDSTFLDTRTLMVYENLLPNDDFYRIHRSVIVNIQYIDEYRRDRGNYVKLSNGKELPIAKKRLHEFIKKIRPASE